MLTCQGPRPYLYSFQYLENTCNTRARQAFLVGEAMGGAEFEQAVDRHKDRIHSYAAWMLHDLDAARDVTQEVFVRLWIHRDKVDAGTAGAWLTRATHNLCIDRGRRKKVRPQADPAILDSMQDEGLAGPERRVHSVELAGAIGRAMARLSERDRAAVLMREVQGMSYGEIADVLDVPLGTLKAVLHRARERLRNQLLEAGVQP